MSGVMPQGNGWSEWQRHVLAELERLANKADCLDRKVGDLRVEVGRLAERVTLRATLVGFLAGSLPVLMILLKGWLL